ncbi:MAG: class I SAM-dependent methyltransferase [Candidatus Micrarchaeia archaeon]
MSENFNISKGEGFGNYMQHPHSMGFRTHGAEGREDPSKLLSSLIPHRVESIADIGCGTGFYSKYLLNYASRVYCIDINNDSLVAASESIKSERLVCLNVSGEDTNLPSNSVDIVFMANSFHDMADKEAAAKEVERILVEGGKLIVIDWKKDSTFGPPQYLKLSEDNYIKYFNNLSLEKSFDFEMQHYCLVFSKPAAHK